MQKFIIPFIQLSVVFAMIITSGYSYGMSLADKTKSIVPEGTVAQEKEREVQVRTKGGSIVEVEFERNGEFEEASGKSPDKDTLVPGQGLVPLSAALDTLKKENKSATGDWSLEKSFIKGWIYEFEGFESGKEVDYLVDAKTGKFLETRIDD